MGASPPSWLLLVHQVPPKPDYLRVKVRRRLQGAGSLPLKSTVYALPDSDACREDFAWIAREIREMGGEAVVWAARPVEGLTAREIQDGFRRARDADYAALAQEARAAGEILDTKPGDAEPRQAGRALLVRLKRRLAEIGEIDFFDADGRFAAQSALGELERRLAPSPREEASARKQGTTKESYRGRTWVTRRGVRIDRMASAWLIHRFIDHQAQFKFVEGQDYAPRRGELRFDMFGGEFTHEGDRCTFEVLLERFALTDPGLEAVAEIVHDLDLKDAKFGRPETAGVGLLIAGITAASERDEERLQRGGALFDDLLHGFPGGPAADAVSKRAAP